MKHIHGRSMIEMLGVLAIIGVLSIGGLAAYRIAMNRYRANQITDMITRLQFAAAELCPTDSDCRFGNWHNDRAKNISLLCNNYGSDLCSETLPYYDGAKWYFGRSAEAKTLVWTTNGLSPALCKELVKRNWGPKLKKMTVGNHIDITDSEQAFGFCDEMSQSSNFYLFWYIE